MSFFSQKKKVNLKKTRPQLVPKIIVEAPVLETPVEHKPIPESELQMQVTALRQQRDELQLQIASLREQLEEEYDKNYNLEDLLKRLVTAVRMGTRTNLRNVLLEFDKLPRQ